MLQFTFSDMSRSELISDLADISSVSPVKTLKWLNLSSILSKCDHRSSYTSERTSDFSEDDSRSLSLESDCYSNPSFETPPSVSFHRVLQCTQTPVTTKQKACRRSLLDTKGTLSITQDTGVGDKLQECRVSTLKRDNCTGSVRDLPYTSTPKCQQYRYNVKPLEFPEFRS